MRANEGLRFETSVTVSCGASPQVVYDTVADLRSHLEWSGERASDDDFKLLGLDAPGGAAQVGTEFTSTGANFNGTFHDRSVVTEATPPNRFAIETQARLDRRRGKTWEVEFLHRYDIRSEGEGSVITWMRPITRAAIHKGDTKQLENLARLAEERATG
jgi:hypothetical protein